MPNFEPLKPTGINSPPIRDESASHSHSTKTSAVSFPQPTREGNATDNQRITSHTDQHTHHRPIVDTDLLHTKATGDSFTGAMPGGFYVTVEKHMIDGGTSSHIASTPHISRIGNWLRNIY